MYVVGCRLGYLDGFGDAECWLEAWGVDRLELERFVISTFGASRDVALRLGEGTRCRPCEAAAGLLVEVMFDAVSPSCPWE